MEAYVSGIANRAAIINGEQALLFISGKPEPTEMKSSEARRLFLHLDDALIFRGSSRSEILQKLNFESNKSNALAMTVMLLDKNIDEEDKIELANRVNILMQSDFVYDYLCSIMFTRPLEDEAVESIPTCISNNLERLFPFIEQLLSAQSELASIFNQINSFLDKKAIQINDRNLIEGILVNKSFYYSVVSNQFDSKKLQLIKFDIVKKLKNSNIVDYVHFGNEFCQKLENRINVKSTKKEYLYSEMVSEKDESKGYGSKGKVLPNSKAHYLSVQNQIKAIIEKLNASKILQAQKLIEELKTQQVERGDNEYAAISLCAISEHAKKLSLFDYQLVYALEASRLAPQDYRTYGHVADAYLNNENLALATEYFEKAAQGDIANRVYALTGMARIEKQKYNYEAALIAINKVLDNNYNDPVPLLTKAEILRELHAYDEAENIYIDLRRNFPEVSRAVYGHASLHAERKDFPRAIDIYKLGLSNYSDHESQCIGKSALGFLYARLGKRSEARKLLTAACKLTKYESITPHISLAKAYRLEGNYGKAQSELLNLLRSRPHFYEVADELIDLYISIGEVGKARDLFDNLKPKLKEARSLQLRNAQIYKHAGAYDSAMAIVDKLKQENPKYISCLLERASIFKMLGNYPEARSQYDKVLKINRNNRTAKFNIIALDKLENKNVFISNLDSELTQTIDDFEYIAQVGLLELSIGKYKEGKLKLLKAYNSGFGVFKNTVSSNLSMASIMLGQTNAAIKPIKKPLNSIEHLQKAIVLLEQKKIELFKQQLILVERHAPPFAINLVKMMKNISNAANDDLFSTEELIEEQIKIMLIAA